MSDDQHDLTAYLHPGWAPLIRPAEATRPWMDASPESFAYRCLPLNIANAHGWEILSPCHAEACWNGRGGTQDVQVKLPPGLPQGAGAGVAVRRGCAHLPYPGPVPDSAGLGPMDRPLTEPAERGDRAA